MGNRSQTDAALLTIAKASCRIGRHRKLHISAFALYPGQQWCIFGGNGAGKTLFAQLLSGRLTGVSGTVAWAPDFDPRRQIVEVSFEAQQRLWALDDRHDISEYQPDATDAGTTVQRLILGAEDPEPLNLSRFRELVSTLELQALLNQGIRYLSSGQVRRAMLARALMGKADGRFRLLILDDPLESIDRDSREPVRQLLKNWMDDQSCVVQLCRRSVDILPGITHMALMHDLVLQDSGDLETLKAGNLFRKLTEIRPVMPPKLPQPSVATAVTDDTCLIELRQVTATYADRIVLNQVSWTMRSGQHVLIEGPNGCGKSTLLSLIDGENHKAYGQDVYLFGQRRGSGESVWDIKARFGVVSNELHNRYVRGWKVLEVVVSGFFSSVGLYEDSGASQAEAARNWLKSFAIDALDSAYYHELSFGQQRLVLLARAMVKFPTVLILDEPCVGLDDQFRAIVLSLIDCIADCTSTHIIYVSHTTGEEPGCINQRIQFIPAREGGFTLSVS